MRAIQSSLNSTILSKIVSVSVSSSSSSSSKKLTVFTQSRCLVVVNASKSKSNSSSSSSSSSSFHRKHQNTAVNKNSISISSNNNNFIFSSNNNNNNQIQSKNKARSSSSSSTKVFSTTKEADSEAGDEKKEYDIYRDSPLRYVGYANECGESFAAWLPPIGVPATYGIAALYVLADTFDKAIKANNEKGLKEGVIVGLDTVTWQMLASVFWPGSFIRVMVNASTLLVSKLPADIPDIGGLEAVTIEKALPTFIGLITIPFIVKPIDKTIDWAMEESVTKVLRGKCESPVDYAKAAAIVGGCLAVPPALFSFAGFIGDLV